MSSIQKKFFTEIRCTSAGDSGKKFEMFSFIFEKDIDLLFLANY